MRFSSPLRILVASSLASLAIAACGDDNETVTQSTPNGNAGAAGRASGGNAGKAGASGESATAGSAGTSAGSAGTSAGNGGSSAGSAGTSAGSAGTSAGSAGTSAGSAGTSAGSAGTSAGSAGTSAGSAGTSAGSAGTSAGSAGNGGSTAGSAGSGGSTAGSAGSGGQSVAQPQCGGIVDTCTLHDDCCNCLALGPGEQAPACDDKTCKASACELLGKPSTACNAGQCTLTLGCGSAEVTCKQPMPPCEKGKVAEVKDACWTGKCIDVTECARVSKCSDCAAAGKTCVTISTNSAFPIVHCVDLPAACDEASCSCLGPAVCTGGANLCSDGGKTGLTCSCPTC